MAAKVNFASIVNLPTMVSFSGGFSTFFFGDRRLSNTGGGYISCKDGHAWPEVRLFLVFLELGQTRESLASMMDLDGPP